MSGRAFQVAGPACENARSPNFVRSRGRESIDEVEDERSPQRDLLAPTDCMDCFRHIRRAATVMDGVDEAAQLKPYPVADRQPMQLDLGRRDVLGATQAEHQSGSCILNALYIVAAAWTLAVPPTRYCSSPAWTLSAPGPADRRWPRRVTTGWVTTDLN